MEYSQYHDPVFGFRWREDLFIVNVRPITCSESGTGTVEKSIFSPLRGLTSWLSPSFSYIKKDGWGGWADGLHVMEVAVFRRIGKKKCKGAL